MTSERFAGFTAFATLVVSFACGTAGYADDGKNAVATVMVASPSTTYAGKKVVESEVLTTIGALKTGAEGGAKVRLTGNEIVVELGANSEINLVHPPGGEPSDSIELIRGKVRVRVPKAKARKGGSQGEKPRFLLRHNKLTMGVRGTDFFVATNEFFGEAELVVFEGDVEFANGKSGKDSQRVTAGSWSAYGGRFGDKIRAPMRLSAKGIEYFEKLSRDVPAFVLQSVPTEKEPAPNRTALPGQ